MRKGEGKEERRGRERRGKRRKGTGEVKRMKRKE